MPRKVPLATPGEILLHDFLEPMGITQYRLAKEIGVPHRRVGEIVVGRRSIAADTALRLAAFFGTRKPDFVGSAATWGRPPGRVLTRPWKRSQKVGAGATAPCGAKTFFQRRAGGQDG